MTVAHDALVHDAGVIEHSSEEEEALLERLRREPAGMTASGFHQRLRAGEWDDVPDDGDLGDQMHPAAPAGAACRAAAVSAFPAPRSSWIRRLTHGRLSHGVHPSGNHTFQCSRRRMRLPVELNIDPSVVHGVSVERGTAHTAACSRDVRKAGGRDLPLIRRHPGISRVPSSRLHRRGVPGAMARHHLAVSRVSIERMIRFVILEPGARPPRDARRAGHTRLGRGRGHLARSA